MNKGLHICILALTLLVSFCLGYCAFRYCNQQPETIEDTALETASNEYGPYSIDLISPNIWHIQDFNTENPAGESFDEQGEKTHFNNCSDLYLLKGDHAALLVDLSNYILWNDSAVASLRHLVAERTGDLPLTITFTHNHGDHVGMLPAYKEDKAVKFALSKEDFEDRLEMFPKEQLYLIEEGYTFDLGGLEVNTVKVPGHTKGSVVFDVKGRDILLTGDAVGSGHGVWIFDRTGFDLYKEAVPHLIEYVTDPSNGIDTTALRVFGGHYWQKDWMAPDRQGINAPALPALADGQELGMSYLRDMEQAVRETIDGTVRREDSGLNFKNLDSYFIHESAVIVWNKDQAEEMQNEK